MAIQKKIIGTSPAGTANSNATIETSAKTSGWTEFSKHIMTGISYMIPMLIMGGLIGAISQVVPYGILNVDPSLSILDAINSGKYTGGSFTMLQIASIMESFGFTLFGFAIPIFTAFTANSIGGRTALAAGFIGGYIAIKPVAMLSLADGKWAAKAPVASGFLGAILIAFIIGYFVKWLNEKINMPHKWLAFKTTFLIPLIAALACLVFMVFLITPFGGWVNNLIKGVLQAAGSSGQFVYALVLSAATAFDLGGPVNKAAGFVALGFTTEQVLPITARCLAIVIPSFGLGLSTLIDKKLVGRSVYDKQFYQLGKTAIFLGFMGISEGSIPFALERPAFCIPLYVSGAVLGALSAVAMGAVQWFPESAIWAWPLVKGIVPYILGLIIGSTFIAVVNVFYRNKLIKDGRLVVNE
ncbi:MAG TPA: PTS fructose transporter subunit IIC [Selenomonadales bacterium]|nr:PTS fructose transporter subunit IIC [Selenomonadales bacterium]